jgi:hypothetical protein
MAPNLTLLIKGMKDEALEAAELRGIPVSDANQNPESNETTCVTHEHNLTHVIDWFNEGPFEAPFPAGTLLWYGIKNKEEFDT